MSGAQQEADFDESVFDTAGAVDAAPAPTPEPAADADVEAKPAPEPKHQIQDTAKRIGWSDKADWKGDPADWIDAPEFILKAAGEVLPSMRKSLEKANEEIAGLKRAVKTSIQHVTKARQEGYEQRSRELQGELARFAAAGDVENVRAVTEDIVGLAKEAATAEAAPAEPDSNPDFDAFKESNDWFEKDTALTAAFNAICVEVHKEGYASPKAGLKEALGRLKEAFPEKFAKPENPNRRQPGMVEGGGTVRRQGGKSFSDMPRENQEACLELMKLSKAITKENYAKEFFAGAAQ
jgi:hypothetical protein